MVRIHSEAVEKVNFKSNVSAFEELGAKYLRYFCDPCLIVWLAAFLPPASF